MKTIFKLTLAAVLALTICACSDNEGSLDELESKTLTFDELFEKVSALKLDPKSEHVINIEYKWNKVTNLVSIVDINEEEPDFFVLEKSSLKSASQTAKYYVSCSNGGNSWTKDCDGKISCGGLIADCLDEGGCATICTYSMIYVPQISTFYLK